MSSSVATSLDISEIVRDSSTSLGMTKIARETRNESLIMRKTLIALLILILAMPILWLWRGRDFSMLIDRFHLIETSSRPIKTIAYEGNGADGILHVDDLDLSLNETELGSARPSIGTTKDDQLALSFGGKVFPFGPIKAGTGSLVAATPSGDVATISIQHSPISWPNFFETNFMTGRSPSWKRHIYQKLVWKKPTGAKLEMLWRYEQYFYPEDRWVEAFMTRPGSTGLIRIDISNAGR